MSMAMMKAKRAIDSIKAKARRAIGKRVSFVLGFRAIEERRFENKKPRLKPTPSKEIEARPAPINLAAFASIIIDIKNIISIITYTKTPSH
jgi:hypothetical protein